MSLISYKSIQINKPTSCNEPKADDVCEDREYIGLKREGYLPFNLSGS